MKIETQFEKKLKEIYDLLAIPYPPKTLYNSEVEVDVEEIAEENSIEIKPFTPKIKPYNINKDILTCHKATKQLTKFLAEMERMRRTVAASENKDDTNFLKYKENVVNFIENLSSKAKVYCDYLCIISPNLSFEPFYCYYLFRQSMLKMKHFKMLN